MRKTVGFLLLALLVLASSVPAAKPAVYAKDVDFALKELKKRCGHFFKSKGIDWRAVEKEFRKAVREVKTDAEHWVLLTRLLARLEDGHAYVKKLEAAGDLEWPQSTDTPQGGPGMFWCRSDGRILVKNCWSVAQSAGIEAGMQVVAVDGLPAEKWLELKVAERGDLMSFSTDHQAFYAACHWGLGGDQGSRMKLECRRPDGSRKKATIARGRASTVPGGPAFLPEGLERTGRQSYGKTAGGYGYIHLRDAKGTLPEQVDTALAAIGEVEGLILDCRANGGGGFDHGGLFGRFVAKGEKWKEAGGGGVPSAGENPYSGNMVVIIDAGVRSAGETLSGMFKEYRRAWVIGESPTAGMSSSKETIELPSGLFGLYVSVRSNMRAFNGGAGIEGIGILPHEVVEYDSQDLSEGVDTMIRRAEELLADFPAKELKRAR